MKIKTFSNLHLVLLYRIAILMLLYSIVRVLFYGFNYEMFGEISLPVFRKIMLGGLKFDISALMWANLLYIFLQIIPFRVRYRRWYQKICQYLFHFTNTVFMLANCVDIIYYRFIHKRTTVEVFDNIKHETNLGKLFFRFIFVDYWYVTVIFIALVLVQILLYNLVRVRKSSLKNIIYYPVNTLLMGLFGYLAIVGIRGTFVSATVPMMITNAGAYAAQPNQTAIVLNTPFSLIKTIESPTLSRVKYYDKETLNEIYTPVHIPNPNNIFTSKNVVIILLEGISQEFIGSYSSDLHKGYTPFLDSLIARSFSFPYAYANARITMDGVPAVLASIPSFSRSYSLSPYSLNKVESLSAKLKPKGYHTAFFHGAGNVSMGLSAFAQINGFQEYYGKDEYNNSDDDDGYWGIRDEEFLQFSARTMKDFPQPFMTTLLTLSSHHPYTLPDKHKGRFPTGNLDIHPTVGYADYALKRFFDTVSQYDWFKNTLFVITADHSSFTEHARYRTSIGKFAIPIIFYEPNSHKRGTSEKIAQQIDIMPSVLGYLGYEMPYFSFGRNLFDDEQENWAINSINEDTYQIVMGDYLLIYRASVQKITGVFRFKEDRLLKNNLAGKYPEVETQLLQKLKAFEQQYINRLIENKTSLTQ